MGYTIIFKDKVIDVGNGDLLYLVRHGCNNDDYGREKGIYEGYYYSEQEYAEYAESLMEDSEPYLAPGDWYMKIGSRCATDYDYGKHLKTMYNRRIQASDVDYIYGVTRSTIPGVFAEYRNVAEIINHLKKNHGHIRILYFG